MEFFTDFETAGYALVLGCLAAFAISCLLAKEPPKYRNSRGEARLRANARKGR